jgi:hypothetical protein
MAENELTQFAKTVFRSLDDDGDHDLTMEEVLDEIEDVGAGVNDDSTVEDGEWVYLKLVSPAESPLYKMVLSFDAGTVPYSLYSYTILAIHYTRYTPYSLYTILPILPIHYTHTRWYSPSTQITTGRSARRSLWPSR